MGLSPSESTIRARKGYILSLYLSVLSLPGAVPSTSPVTCLLLQKITGVEAGHAERQTGG